MADAVAIHQYPRGTTINFTHGEYSNFSNVGLMTAQVDLDLPKLKEEYRAEVKAGKDPGDWDYDDDANPREFPSWLIRKGYCIHTSHEEVHLGAYGGWEI